MLEQPLNSKSWSNLLEDIEKEAIEYEEPEEFAYSLFRAKDIFDKLVIESDKNACKKYFEELKVQVENIIFLKLSQAQRETNSKRIEELTNLDNKVKAWKLN